ncbi:MAG: DMT family transporter, partial [Fimbriimonadaceae bacterium]|nr:DMT family transporter [Alphaproteobacteria bacterium]
LGQLAQLAAAPLFAMSYLVAKRLTDYEDPMAIVGMLSIFCTLTLLPGALWQWRNPTGEEMLWLTLTAFLATAGHYTLTKAFRAAPIMVTQPVGFLQLVWAALIGMTLFGEALDIYTFIGAGVIVSAATYISHREAQASRQEIVPPAIATKV